DRPGDSRRFSQMGRSSPQTSERSPGGEAGERVIGAARKGLGEVAGTRVEDILTSEGDLARAQAAHNEALYQQAIELAALQRVTAGGFDPGFVIAVPLPH